MKTPITIMMICFMLLFGTMGFCQKATIWGYIYLVTQRDTISLGRAHVVMYKLTPGKGEQMITDFYTRDDGKYVAADIPYGSYYYKIYYGKEAPLQFFTPGGSIDKGPWFTVDQLLEPVPAMYVRKT